MSSQSVPEVQRSALKKIPGPAVDDLDKITKVESVEETPKVTRVTFAPQPAKKKPSKIRGPGQINWAFWKSLAFVIKLIQFVMGLVLCGFQVPLYYRILLLCSSISTLFWICVYYMNLNVKRYNGRLSTLWMYTELVIQLDWIILYSCISFITIFDPNQIHFHVLIVYMGFLMGIVNGLDGVRIAWTIFSDSRKVAPAGQVVATPTA